MPLFLGAIVLRTTLFISSVFNTRRQLNTGIREPPKSCAIDSSRQSRQIYLDSADQLVNWSLRMKPRRIVKPPLFGRNRCSGYSIWTIGDAKKPIICVLD